MSKQKSYKQWAQHLPKQLRKPFIANCENTKSLVHNHKSHDSLSEMIEWGFVWNKTPQGHDLWRTLLIISAGQERAADFTGRYSWKGVVLPKWRKNTLVVRFR